MFVYWGGNNSGKKEVQQTVYANEGKIGYLLDTAIITYTDIVFTDTGCDVTKRFWGKNSGFRYEQIEWKRYNTPHSWWGAEYGKERNPQIDTTRQFRKRPKDVVRNNKLKSYTNTFTSPFSLKSIGLDEMNILFKTVAPHVENTSVVNQLKSFSHTHIVPYRVITEPEKLIPKIQMWSDHRDNSHYKTVFQQYDERPDLVFEYISSFFREQRYVEEKLREQNVDYVYYDLDSYDVASVTGLEKNFHIPESYHLWKLDDPDTKKRFDKALEICDAYLKSTGLSDTRLDFRSKDGI
jgi:hypothetical protein